VPEFSPATVEWRLWSKLFDVRKGN